MAAPRDPRVFVERLEDRIEKFVSGRDRVALAFSGGLASTLLAMIARKRCDLRCLVAGQGRSVDIRAAKEAKTYFDFRVDFIALGNRAIRGISERIAQANRDLSFSVVRALVPIRAVLDQWPNGPVLAGFHSRATKGPIAKTLRAWNVRTPLADLARGRKLSRSTLQAAAISLGLPAEWARVVHRGPAAGAGIQGAFRMTGNMRG